MRFKLYEGRRTIPHTKAEMNAHIKNNPQANAELDDILARVEEDPELLGPEINTILSWTNVGAIEPEYSFGTTLIKKGDQYRYDALSNHWRKDGDGFSSTPIDDNLPYVDFSRADVVILYATLSPDVSMQFDKLFKLNGFIGFRFEGYLDDQEVLHFSKLVLFKEDASSRSLRVEIYIDDIPGNLKYMKLQDFAAFIEEFINAHEHEIRTILDAEGK